jgi:hypothetical protein
MVATTDTKGQSLLDPSTQQKFGNPLAYSIGTEPITISIQFTQDLG